MSYKNYYMCETIRPIKVFDALNYLMTTELYKEHAIEIADEWLRKNPCQDQNQQQ